MLTWAGGQKKFPCAYDSSQQDFLCKATIPSTALPGAPYRLQVQERLGYGRGAFIPAPPASLSQYNFVISK
jgi:hypothetical protein